MTDTPIGKGLGRLHQPDPRDGKYMLPRRAKIAGLVRSKYWRDWTPILDQGETSQCVIYSCDKFLTASPICNPGFGDTASRARIYREVQKLDDWDGEDYEGTSVRAIMKWLQGKGLISAYAWAFDYETAINHILTTGPLCLGTDWYMDMFYPDAKTGFIKATGANAGGHAYIAIGANRDKKCPDGSKGAVRIINSWGESWGQGGRAWLSFTDLDKLIQAHGEAATPSEVKAPKTA